MFEVEDKVYKDYLILSEDLEWTGADWKKIKIKYLEDIQINEILDKLYKMTDILTMERNVEIRTYNWIRVFEDVKIKRRINKINKIKNGI